jgi:hypothetical protein
LYAKTAHTFCGARRRPSHVERLIEMQINGRTGMSCAGREGTRD